MTLENLRFKASIHSVLTRYKKNLNLHKGKNYCKISKVMSLALKGNLKSKPKKTSFKLLFSLKQRKLQQQQQQHTHTHLYISVLY